MKSRTRINMLAEFEHALADGLGRKSAKEYEVMLLAGECPGGVAHALGKKTIYLLLDGTDEQEGRLTVNEYFEYAKRIGTKFNAFVVPDQSLNGNTFWGGKRRGPIISYKFRIIGPSPLVSRGHGV